MGFPLAVGQPSFSGIYIPEIWASKMLVKFYAATGLTEIANTEYEGEIKQRGDTVHISTLPDMQIKDYTVGMELETDKPTPTVVDLLINKGKYFQFASNPVMVKQASVEYINKWAEDAARQMKIAIERAVLADVYADASAYNKGATAGKISADVNLGTAGSPFALTKDNVLDKLFEINQVLDEQDVPAENRWIYMPAWACTLMKGSDLKNASITGDSESLIRKGVIGMVDKLMIIQSNLLATGTDGGNKVTNAIAGHKSALAFATQLTENQVIDNPKDFGKLHRGLQVYGYKVVKPEAMVHFYIRKG